MATLLWKKMNFFLINPQQRDRANMKRYRNQPYCPPRTEEKFKEVIINNTKYLRNVSKRYLTSTGPEVKLIHWLPDEDPRAYLSDHTLEVCEYDGLRIGTFNACMTRLSLRMKEGLHNAEGQYKGFITGDSMPTDDLRRQMILAYIQKLFSEKSVDILLLQEIDYSLYNLLLGLYSVAFCEEHQDANAGGNAIVVAPGIDILSHEHVYDTWKNGTKIGKKLVGIKCQIKYNTNTIKNIINVHLDVLHKKYSVPLLTEIVNDTNNHILGGDFNSDSSLIRNISEHIAELTNGRIDHIFNIN